MKENRKFFLALKNLPRAACLFSAALLAALCLPPASRAQDTGYISGTISDKTGAVVVGANIVVSLEGGNLTRTTESNADGAYVVAALPGGTYDITVTATGFQKYQAKGVVLNVAQKARVDITLTVGTVTEEVVVTGENVAQVETQSSDLSSTITGKQVNQLELNGRNFTQLVTLTPGVVSQTGQDEGTVGVYGNVSYSFNGGRTEYNNWELDGGDNMDNGSNTTLNVYPSLEAISEFKVLTSNYGAQYGRNGSGTVEVETKSGTNSLHGSAYEYLRNDMFNARPWSSGSDPTHPNPPYKKHDFGYTFGGPVVIPHIYNPSKRKTFFFWSQEWRREKDPYNIAPLNVPSDAERTGNFSDVCPPYSASTPVDATAFPDCPTQPGSGGLAFTNNQVTVDPTGQALLALIPHANTTLGGLPAYTHSLSLPTTWREELVRVDHNINDNERLTFRYIHDSWKTVTNQTLWGQYPTSFDNINTNFGGPGTSFVARLTSTISPSLLNEFVASYTADHIILSDTGPLALPSGFAMGSLFNNSFGGKLPAITLGANAVYGVGGALSADTGYMPWKNANPTYTYRDNMTKIIGNHTLQFGAYFAAAQKNQMNSVDVQGQLTFSNTAPNSTGNGFADLLVGNVSSYTQNNAQTEFYDRYKILEPYFQDDWRMTKKFTLNLGLRWSFFGRYQERYNQEYNFSPAAWVAANAPAVSPTDNSLTGGNIFNGLVQCGVSPTPTGCMTNKWINPAPRFGFAWDPFGDGKWAVRGGYGIFFEHTNGNEANAETLQGSVSPKLLSGTQSNVTGYANIGGTSGLSPAFPSTPYSIPDRAAWPYVQQWNLDVQHELPAHFVVSVAYVGSKGTHLTNQRDLNQFLPLSGQNPYAPGQAIQSGDCANFQTDPTTGVPTSGQLANGTPVTGQAVVNLWVACSNNTDFLRKYLGYDRIIRIESNANSIYNALQVSARRTLGSLTMSFAYTYSHSIDDSSDRYDGGFVNSFDLARSRASSNFDQRHSAAISYVYTLPFFKSSSGFTKALLGGWEVSGITTLQTGTPLISSGASVVVANQTGFNDSAGVANGVGTQSVPDLVGNPSQVTAAQQAAAAAGGVVGPLLYNPTAFAIPTGLTFGDMGRNILYMPGRVNFDFGAFKRFAIGEKAAFEFRWETFNLFNHTQYNSIDQNMDCATGPNAGACVATSSFLHLNGTHAPRIMQFGLRFQF